MERIFIADFVIHSTDQYLVVGVHFHLGRWFSEFPSELEYCFDERFVFQGVSGHFYSHRVFSEGVVCARAGVVSISTKAIETDA